LIPYLNLPKKPGIVVRGEFILSKQVFENKYKQTFANARNLVSGIVNRTSIDNKVEDLDFVAYEVIQPVLRPSEQFAFLQTTGLKVVQFQEVDTNLTNEYLSQLLINWRKNYTYEIDGIIVTNDAIYPRTSGNPDHSFAFKMVLSDQLAEAKVVDVIWSPSKDGYLKPRVQIEPIQLGGVRIEFATGFNASFIEENKIGVGAVVQLVRSGDVIPYIKSIVVPASEPKMPDVAYTWNATHVDILLEDRENNATVKEKNITGFFRGIEVDGLSGGNVSRIIEAGFDTVQKILQMTQADFLRVQGFKEKLATKLHEGIREKLEKASLADLMAASNLFGRGFSDKKIELILEEYPKVLTDPVSQEEKTKKVASIKGMATPTATVFVAAIPTFLGFLEESGLQDKLEKGIEKRDSVDPDHPLYKKKIVMTGFRSDTIERLLKRVGASLSSSVSKSTFVLIVKDAGANDSGKAIEAKKLQVPIQTEQEFLDTYFSNEA
jgi:NAD-dependent DNA ligase